MPDDRAIEPPQPRLAILSFSSGEYDARSFRIARSAIAAGYHVTLYTRWHAGQLPVEEREGYRLIRAPFDWRLAVPGLRGAARRKAAAAMADAARLHEERFTAGSEADESPETSDAPEVLPSASLAGRVIRRAFRRVKRWRRIVMMFPLRPLGWAVALDDLVEPADVWHGMWAGSLPALARMRRLHGGRTIYDSRDVYMLSRDFSRLEWPIRPILTGLERRWAGAADRVLTVNEPYADLIVEQLGVPRPPVVVNCPERWTPPRPAPDRIREATGVSRSTAIALYQGQLTSERGIEQAMEAILEVPGAVLVLLGYGPWQARLVRLAAEPPYAGKVYVLPAVTPEVLLEWTASADVMVMPIQPTTTNHRFTTPQKLWEAIAAGVPVVASDLPGMATVIAETGVGVVCDPTRPASIGAAITTVLRRSPDEQAALRAHVLRIAHERYNWEAQLDTLFAVYSELGPVPQSPRVPAAPASTAVSRPPTPPGARLSFVPAYSSIPPGDVLDEDVTYVILDTAWTPTSEEASARVVLVRDVVERILSERDLFADAAEGLNDWAEASGIVELMVHDGVSYWYGARLGHWTWLLGETLWLAVVDRLLAEHAGTRVLECAAGADAPLVAAARLIAERDGLALTGSGVVEATVGIASMAATPRGGPARATAATPPRKGRGIVRRIARRFRPPEPERRRRLVHSRLDALEAEPARRLLAVQAHARQRIDSPTGSRHVNVYLGSVIDQLRGTALEPVELDLRATMSDDESWPRVAARGARRTLPNDVLRLVSPHIEPAPARAAAAALAASIAELRTPLWVAGVDLGPALAARVAERVGATHARRLLDTERIRTLIRRLHPAGILLADEYHRQDWLTAATSESVPVAAIQHGVIYRWHTGYIHRTRPAALRLPDRLYVFGRWERDLLTATSVYEPGEVVAAGSPRLDLVAPTIVDVSAVRVEVGAAPGDRLVVLSGTWGELYRRFHYPIALSHLFARPIDRMHLVVKLHPSERDEGPYRRVIEGLAAAGGFAPPPITVVQDVDLYRLLAAADAHLGIHSTVLTEAVATGTPNLLATGLAAADLLGYVEAGVAIPVATSEDLAAALDRPREAVMTEVDRRRFIALHFEPGSASTRIASDLLEWLK